MSILARENDVFFCPSVDLPAMRAGEFRRLNFGRRPQVFFNGLAGRRKFRRGRTADEKTFDNGAGFYFPRGCCFKEFHLIRAGKQCALCRRRKATSGV